MPNLNVKFAIQPSKALVNTPQTDAELDAVRTAIRRGSPLGGEQWQHRIAKRLGLESTLRLRGRTRATEK